MSAHDAEPLAAPALGDRSLFPDLAAPVFLNHAAVSPPSAPVQRAVRRALGDYAAHGVGAVPRWIEQREALREALAGLIGARGADEIGLVLNTSAGVAAIAQCLDWSPGDRVVVLRGEFPTNITPWQQAARRFELELVWIEAEALVDGSGAGLGQLEAALGEGVRLVAVSAVQFQTGWRMPLQAIGRLCRAHGAELFVDGIQACGVVALDVEALQIDYLACGGHKWLMGVEGAGMLYVRRGRVGDSLQPWLAGWLSHQDPLEFLFEPGQLRYDRPLRQRADVFEGGALNALGYAGLGAAVELLEELGVEAIWGHVTAYLDELERRLQQDLGLGSRRRPEAAARSGILSIPRPEGVELVALSEAMARRGVACSTPDGHLRFAPHWPNDVAEVDHIVGALAESLRALRG